MTQDSAKIFMCIHIHSLIALKGRLGILENTDMHSTCTNINTMHTHNTHMLFTCFRQGGEAAMVLLLIISYCNSDSLKHAAVSHS